ncbi:MAG: endolytic transglycosylase MltG [Candidatus Cloacimonetes bacterium]|nr:endolytic transglycosylase MltG [Candidatus Cloacimonadota bacterium]
MIKLKYILLAGLCFIALITATLLYLVLIPTWTEEQIVNIHPGENARGIANKLYDANIIRSRTVFIALVKIQGADRDLKIGSYIFGGKASLWKTVQSLQKGLSEEITITFPEGLSLFKTLKRINNSGLISYDSLYAAATNKALVKRLTGIDAASLEGFLYPETYRFSIALSADSILATQTAQFFVKLKAEGINPAEIPDFYSKLILASIVEKEAGPNSERELIAGVFMNRMARGMPLQSCPTVDYILEPQGIKREVLSYKETQIRSPYNTYIVQGLPPTPIANPSIASIKAVLKPKHSSYLYFFSDRKGMNVFSRSYEEHLQKQKRI